LIDKLKMALLINENFDKIWAKNAVGHQGGRRGSKFCLGRTRARTQWLSSNN